MNKILIYMVLSCLVLGACQQTIDLDIKSAASKIVIEGNMNDQGDPATVIITQSTAYNDTAFLKTISGALVTVTEPNGIVDTLTEVTSGIYLNASLHAQAGQSYKLHVEALGNTYESTSMAPPPVPIDSVYFTTNGFSNHQRITCAFMDPAGISNYYRASQAVNGQIQYSHHVRDDQFTDGKEMTLNMSDGVDYVTGDTIDVYLQCIDANVYQYYYTLGQNTSANSAAPANPVSNISNGSLGYFNACTITRRRLVIHQ